MDSDGLDGFLSALKAMLDPVFVDQRTTWEREGPASIAAFDATGARLDSFGGNCPVQAEGAFDGHRFYFRARYDEWEFHAWPEEKAANYLELPLGDETFLLEREYGSGFDAGWMPKHEALGFIVHAISEFRITPRTGQGDGSDG